MQRTVYRILAFDGLQPP